MAPSTPPPPSSPELAAFTMASVVSSVMSPIANSRVALEPIRYRTLCAILFVGERFYARKFFAFQKLQRSSAACGDMRNFVGQAGLRDCGNRISATDDGRRAAVSCDGLGDLHGPPSEGGNLKNAHRTIPHDRPGAGDLFAENHNRLRTNIQAHLIGWNALLRFYRLGFGGSVNFFCHHVVQRQMQPDFFAFCIL